MNKERKQRNSMEMMHFEATSTEAPTPPYTEVDSDFEEWVQNNCKFYYNANNFLFDVKKTDGAGDDVIVKPWLLKHMIDNDCVSFVTSTNQGDYTFTPSANDTIKVDIDNLGAVTIVLVSGTAQEVATQINTELNSTTGYNSTYEYAIVVDSKVKLRSKVKGVGSEVDIQVVVNDAYTVLGLTEAVYTNGFTYYLSSCPPENEQSEEYFVSYELLGAGAYGFYIEIVQGEATVLTSANYVD